MTTRKLLSTSAGLWQELLLCGLLCIVCNHRAAASGVVADEGAWCWFADPRALHYENSAGTVNATYIGYIDVHGNVKATQYDWTSGRKTDVLVRSCFQPDDHNNPTFLVLPDERVMIFYTRHTDEPKIWYRVSLKPGDITALGPEKSLATQNNTTYPSPFILSDDPQHIYLCWRGINWHPTIARLTMPDADGNCRFDFGPRQIVQSTGARPYAKYQSNGKDKIYVSYTTGHPDNEQPNWLYFNVIDINHGNGPILRDLNGKQLSVVKNGVFNVNKTEAYAKAYPATIVDRTANIRNWVWQIALDSEERPVIAYTHIDNARTTHVYWYARWTGAQWRNTWVQYAGHAFHQNWDKTELCYSGGAAIDPADINSLYLSIPTRNGQYNKDGVYELWRYTIDDEGQVSGSQQITKDSPKNNVRPYVMPGSEASKMRLVWMQGDYYYWMVRQGYPKGYPTAVHCDYDWQEELTAQADKTADSNPALQKGTTLSLAFAMNADNYEGGLFKLGNMTYTIDTDDYPVVTIGNNSYKSQNRLLTSDDWATKSSGTNGDNHPTKLTTWVVTMSYDGHTLTVYRNGLVDQVITDDSLEGGTPAPPDAGTSHVLIASSEYRAVASPFTVQFLYGAVQQGLQAAIGTIALRTVSLPATTHTDLVLPTEVMEQKVSWKTSNASAITAGGVLRALTADTDVTLTATCGTATKEFTVKAMARDLSKNLRYALPDTLDLTQNTATGFAANKYGRAPEGLLKGLRSYTVIADFNAKSLSGQPRIYDFGVNSGNSLFLRANVLAAGIKLDGGTTTMVTGWTALKTNTNHQVAVTYDAATRVTRIYIDGKLDTSGTANQHEPYQLCLTGVDSRNYIGRTQWWDSSVAADNQDFRGTINSLALYDTALTAAELAAYNGHQPTAISDLAEPRDMTLTAVYDLQGRQLSAPQRPGLYIAHGRKVIIR